MLNKDFYKLRRDFNPRVVPSVDFIPVPDVPGETVPEFNMPYPDPFGGELPLDAVKANPKRGSSTDKKEAFQDFLNRGGSQLVAQVPSQMPGAMGGATPGGMLGSTMGGIPTHGITGNVGAKLGETIGGAFKEGKDAAGDLFNRLLNRRMQNLGTGDLMGMGGIG